MKKVNLKQAVKAAVEAKAAKLKKLSKAQINALRESGAKIVQVAIEAHKTTLEILMACKGKTPEEIEQIKEGVAAAWKKYAEQFTARATHSTTDKVDAMKRQSIYNRNSEMQAILSLFQRYAGWDKAERAKCDKLMPQSYHGMVAFARNYGTKKKKNNETPVAVRERKAWSKKKSERLADVKKKITFAPLDALMNLRTFIDKRIDLLTKAAEAKAKEGGKATVHKLRKAA